MTRSPSRASVHLVFAVLTILAGNGCGTKPPEAVVSTAKPTSEPTSQRVQADPPKAAPPTAATPTAPEPPPTVKLPPVQLARAAFAKPADQPVGDVVVSITATGGLTLGDQPLKTTDALKTVLAEKLVADTIRRSQIPVLRVEIAVPQGTVLGVLRLCQGLGFREARLRVLRQAGGEAAEGDIPLNLENGGAVTYGKRSQGKARTNPDDDLLIMDGVFIEVHALDKGEEKGRISNLIVQDEKGVPFACTTLEKLQKYLGILKEDITPSKEKVRIATDPKLHYGRFLEIMELCQKIGFGQIVLFDAKTAELFEDNSGDPPIPTKPGSDDLDDLKVPGPAAPSEIPPVKPPAATRPKP